MPRYQSQLRLPVFQQVQMLPHQRLFNTRQMPLPESRSPPVKDSQPPTFPQQIHQLLHHHKTASPPPIDPDLTILPFLTYALAEGSYVLGLGGAAATLPLEHHMGALLAAALAECIVSNCAPKPNMGNLPVMCQPCEGTALLATGRLISQGPPPVSEHYPLRYYIQ